MARSTARASLGVLLAGPAGAQTTTQTSGGALAFNDSVASGTCVATDDST